MRQHKRNLDPPSGTYDLQRYVFAVPANAKIDA